MPYPYEIVHPLQMKNLLLSIVALALFQHSTLSQTFRGAEAQKVITGSEIVRVDERSGNVEFVKFHENARFPMSKFPAWAKKALGLEGLELSEAKSETDKLGVQHIRYQVLKNGIPVFGASIYAHGENDLTTSFNGRYPQNISGSAHSISESAALEAAKDFIGAETYKWELPGEEAHLKWETDDATATYFPKGELVYLDPAFDFSKPEDLRLAYKFDIYAHQPLYRAEVFVDAQTGHVLFENNHICSIDAAGTAQTGYSGTRSITTDSYNGGYRLRESGRGNGIRTFDMNQGTDYGSAVDFTDSDNNWNNVNANLDQYATDAHWAAELTYDYYLSEHGRNSLDGAGYQINSYIHYDVDYFNAFWDGQRATFGDGNNQPLTSLDIVAHELTHGVTGFSAELIYQDEYGALNESFSDIFGAATEWVQNASSGDWLMGEDVGTLRSMSNPNAYGDPDTYNGTNWYVGADDNGGVHTNSGVQNKWFYILVEGETGTNDLGNAYNVAGIGLQSAAAIAYRCLSVYLGPTSEYSDARFYSIQAAIDLFGGCSPEVISTTDAWYAVGVGGPFDATVVADFAADITANCEAPATINFSNLSTNGASFVWDFGDGSTSTATNPSHTYAAVGNYTVSLMVDGGNCGTDNVVIPNYISLSPSNTCVALMPDDGSQTLNWCTGTLYDDGGPNENYQDNNSVVTTISPPGATSVMLQFSAFAFEEGYDYLFVYNGPTTNSPLLGQYDGLNLPNGGTISSTGGSITIRQESDVYVTEPGFALTWTCQQPNSPPTALFASSVQETCNGQVTFTDQSINGATTWLWDFGDGTTSTQQNPTHTYQSEGTFSVTLTATNGFGSDAVSYNNLIVVDRPEGPAATSANACGASSLTLNAVGNGTLHWYDQATGGTQVATGSSFNTPVLNTTTSYYVEAQTPTTTVFMGPTTNAFGSGSNFTGDQYLIFDALTPFVLKTVRVYAQGAGERTIQLRNSNGVVLQSTNVNIANGQQTVTLNFPISTGTGYQLGTTPGPNLYRNDSGPSYPYTVQDVASITTSSAGTDYYYFFYNWELELSGCTTERTEVVATVAQAPQVNGADRCGAGTLSLSATGNATLQWYDAAVGGNLVSSGNTYTTPSLSSTTSYFVESQITPSPLSVGPASNAFGSGGNFNNIQSLLFDCYTPVTLVSVRVYAQGAGNRTIELRNSGGTVLQSVTVNIPNGESVVPLNFNLPVGTNLQLGTSVGPDLYRNNSGPSYPYTVPGIVSITGSTAGTDYYYFFYDWVVQQESCTTPRTEVVATINPLPNVSIDENTEICQGESTTLTASEASTYQWNDGQTTATIVVNPTGNTTYSVDVMDANGCVGSSSVQVNVFGLPTQPTISFNGAELESTAATSYHWYLNGTLIEGATDATYSPTETGDYQVEVTDTNGCSSMSEPYDWMAVSVAEMAAPDGNLRTIIYPNPTSGTVSVHCNLPMRNISLMDALGREVTNVPMNGNATLIDLTGLANGMYQLVVQTDQGRAIQKVLKD
jgi:Zn-dependent metalloprotease